MKARRMLFVAGIAIAVLAVPAALQSAGVDVPGVTQNASALVFCSGNYQRVPTENGTSETCDGIYINTGN